MDDKSNSNNKNENNNKKEEKNSEKHKNIIIRNLIIATLIKQIILNMAIKIKSNTIFDLALFQDSKIILKIKGIGENKLFGNEIGYNFTSINYLKQVIINGKAQDTIAYKYYCNQTNNIVELIWDDNLKNCGAMFRMCYNITEIDLSNFNNAQITAMNSMFAHCRSLTSINLYNFDTSQVRNMGSLFFDCKSLTSLNLSGFNTLNTNYMGRMFYGCISLTSLDLSNFVTSKVTSMAEMFYCCSSLTTLNLSNFDTSKVDKMDNMFYNCFNLEYINLENFDESKLNDKEENYRHMFYNISWNTVICINENRTANKIFPQISNSIKCPVIGCINDWKSIQKKLSNNDLCVESCDSNYEYNGKCYDNCEQGYLYDENKNQLKKCKCKLDECLLCPNFAYSKGLCTRCNTNFYKKEFDEFNLGEYIKCYKEPEGYYLENDLYKQCYYTCKMCNNSGNNITHNCIECNDNYPFEIRYYNYINCYQKCKYYYYLDNENNYHCTINSSCPNEYFKSTKDKMKCIKFNAENIMEELITIQSNEIEKMSKEEEIEYYDNILKISGKGFEENYNTTKIDNGQDEVIKKEKVSITFTTTQNQKNNINKNATTIDLGECENELRFHYNLSINETLYMKKVEVVQEGMKIPKIEYDVYSRLFGTNLIKLNLTVCKNSKILISIPIELDENLDIFNSSSGYYNDICYTTTSEYGTDITLNDRKKDFVDKNKMICQEDCEISKYNYETKKVECSCDIKESSLSIKDMNINKDKLFKNFKDIKNIANLNFLVCYKILLKKDGIFK